MLYNVVSATQQSESAIQHAPVCGYYILYTISRKLSRIESENWLERKQGTRKLIFMEDLLYISKLD